MAKRQTILSQGSYGASTSTRQANVVPGSMGDASGLINLGNAISQTGANATKFAKQKQDQLDKEVGAEAEMMVRASARQTEVDWESIKGTLGPGEQMAEWNRISDKHYASLQDSLKELTNEDPRRAERLFGKETVKNAWAEATSRQWKEAGILDVTTKRAEHVVTVVANAQDSIQVNNESPNELIAEFRARAENDTPLLGTLERKEYFTATSSTLLSKLALMETQFPGSVTSEDIKSLAGNTYDEVVSENRTISSKVADPWSPSPIPAYREAPSPYSVTNKSNATYSVKTVVEGEKSFPLLSPDQLIKLNEVRGKSGKQQGVRLLAAAKDQATEWNSSRGTGGVSRQQFQDIRQEVEDNSFIPPDKQTSILLELDASYNFAELTDATKSTEYVEEIGNNAELVKLSEALNTEQDVFNWLSSVDKEKGKTYLNLPPGQRTFYLNAYKGLLTNYIDKLNSNEFSELLFADSLKKTLFSELEGNALVNAVAAEANKLGVNSYTIAATTPESVRELTDIIAGGPPQFTELGNKIKGEIDDSDSRVLLAENMRAISSDEEQPDEVRGAFSVLSEMIHLNNEVPLEPIVDLFLNAITMGEQGRSYMATDPVMAAYSAKDLNIVRATTGEYMQGVDDLNETISDVNKDKKLFTSSQNLDALLGAFPNPQLVKDWADLTAAAINKQSNSKNPAYGYREIYNALVTSIVHAPIGGLNSRNTQSQLIPNWVADREEFYWQKVADGTAAGPGQVATSVQGLSDALFLGIPIGRGFIGDLATSIDTFQADNFTPGNTEFDAFDHLGSNMLSSSVELPEIWRNIDFANLLVRGDKKQPLVSKELMDTRSMTQEDRDFFNSSVGADPWSRAGAVIKKYGSMLYNKKTNTMDLYVRAGPYSKGVGNTVNQAGGMIPITDLEGNSISVPFDAYIDYTERYNADQSSFQRSTTGNAISHWWEFVSYVPKAVAGVVRDAATAKVDSMGNIVSLTPREVDEPRSVDNTWKFQPEKFDLPPQEPGPIMRRAIEIEKDSPRYITGGQ
tara:strand:+ start:1156 stop:4233 length:3078 start_codon:yes stop_codon:yes gene_type:complete